MNATPTPIACTLYSTAPDGLRRRAQRPCRVGVTAAAVTLENGFLKATVSRRQGILTSVTSTVTRASHPLLDDCAGVGIEQSGSRYLHWMAGADRARPFSVRTERTADGVTAYLTARQAGFRLTLVYRLARTAFWIERRLIVEGRGAWRLDRLTYGKLAIPPAADRRVQTHVLELGQCDRPRLLTVNQKGGLFGGLGWWFYTVDETGVYQNTHMRFAVRDRFESEPWYVGVFAPEAGEPYPGWLWYKTFLQQRKLAYDKQPHWSYWNAGWGQWGIDVDDPNAAPYIALARQLGIRQICFGSGCYGKGVPEYLRLMRRDPQARRNVAAARAQGRAFGFIEPGNLGERWNDTAFMDGKIRALRAMARAGVAAYHFDFFYTADTFTGHYNAARYLRAAHAALDYTECHLGIAKYGPQFQREVIVNHPADIGGFDISNFSSDWSSFRAFRHERRQWQTQRQYLMPEYGLYYFLTHYANPHPRLYDDPEPHQLLASYGGQGYNFHDRVGFREVMVAAAAFTPFYIFGHLDLKMPEADVRFTRACLEWVAANHDVLRESRVCFEDANLCVMSKIRDGRGALFIVNFGEGERVCDLTLAGGRGAATLCAVYPTRAAPFRVTPGKAFRVVVRGGSAMVLDVNRGLHSLPPENPRRLPLVLKDWRGRGATHRARLRLPALRAALARGHNAALPSRLFALDPYCDDPQWAAHILRDLGYDGRRKRLPVDVKWLQPSPYTAGKKLDPLFLKKLKFHRGLTAPTWKLSPWAYADRLWLVWKPDAPVPLAARAPRVRVNGRAVALIPKPDFRKKENEPWDCPLFFADLTGVARYGATNTVTVAGLDGAHPGLWYIAGAL